MHTFDLTAHQGEFFKIIGQTDRSQIGVMTLSPGQDSGPEEKHPGDQVVYIISGQAEIEVEEERAQLSAGSACIIPAKTRHHIYNTSSAPLFLLSVYTPPAY